MKQRFLFIFFKKEYGCTIVDKNLQYVTSFTCVSPGRFLLRGKKGPNDNLWVAHLNQKAKIAL